MVQLVEYRTRNQEVAGSTHTQSTARILEQVANLLCSGQLSLLPSAGWEISSYGYRVKASVADWGDGVSASCTVGPTVR